MDVIDFFSTNKSHVGGSEQGGFDKPLHEERNRQYYKMALPMWQVAKIVGDLDALLDDLDA